METIPSAEVFIINKVNGKRSEPPTPQEVEEWMIEFAKIHVEAALKAASNAHEEWGEKMGTWHDTTPIVNAYSLENII